MSVLQIDRDLVRRLHIHKKFVKRVDVADVVLQLVFGETVGVEAEPFVDGQLADVKVDGAVLLLKTGHKVVEPFGFESEGKRRVGAGGGSFALGQVGAGDGIVHRDHVFARKGEEDPNQRADDKADKESDGGQFHSSALPLLWVFVIFCWLHFRQQQWLLFQLSISHHHPL